LVDSSNRNKSLKIEIGGFECHTLDVDKGNYQSPGGEWRNALATTALQWPPSSFLLNVSTTLASRCSIFRIEKIELSSAQEFIIKRIQFHSVACL
jgi:hypothetical protein